jgi:leucyl-tRNA synthetase
MKKQCQSMGWAIDWTREIATCDPAYYRWNQWFFLRLWEKGIVYKKSGDRELGSRGHDRARQRAGDRRRGWRTGASVEKREIPMWYMRITQYADELLDSLDGSAGPSR